MAKLNEDQNLNGSDSRCVVYSPTTSAFDGLYVGENYCKTAGVYIEQFVTHISFV
jgi:hypothetical protein